MRFVNLTPHAIAIHDLDGRFLHNLPPEGPVARVSTTHMVTERVRGVPLLRQVTGEVVGLPEFREGVLLIVSAMVREACPHRTDIFSPGPLLRDEQGRPRGCKGLIDNR